MKTWGDWDGRSVSLFEPDDEGITLTVSSSYRPSKPDAPMRGHQFGKHWWAFMGSERAVICLECGVRGSMEQVKDVGAEEMSHQSRESLNAYDAFKDMTK